MSTIPIFVDLVFGIPFIDSDIFVDILKLQIILKTFSKIRFDRAY